jgi:hypothetical protein
VRLRQLLDELARYLSSVAEMGNPHDNRVYVVSLSSAISEAGVSYIEVVETLGVYWYPAGGPGGWPKTPPNYVGFRYGGELRGIRHVEHSRLVADLADAVPQVKHPSWGPAFVLTLGPPIPIPSGVRTGSQIVRSARRVVDIDCSLRPRRSARPTPRRRRATRSTSELTVCRRLSPNLAPEPLSPLESAE